MQLLAEFLFWTSIGVIFYIYIGYFGVLQVCMSLLGKKGSGVQDATDFTPMVSVIVAAFNEERVIRARINDLLELDYPKDKLEIIIASDGSEDKTVPIAREFENENIKVLDFKQNRGRAAVHNDSVKVAEGEILVFTDSETTFDKYFLRKALPYFQDPDYGCGTGDYTFAQKGTMGETESLYWRLEKKILKLEHKLGILPFSSGGCLIVRKSLWSPIPEHSDIDNCVPYRVVQKGYKVFYAENAYAYDVTIEDSNAHYRKRVRTALSGMHGLFEELPQLVKSKKFITVWVLLSHRLFRYITIHMLIIAFLTNILLLKYNLMIYDLLMVGQVVFYSLALVGWIEDKGWLPKIFSWLKYQRFIYSFLLANVAFFVAIYKAIIGEKITAYKPASH